MRAFKLILLAAFGSLVYTSCQHANAQYIDLATGDTVVLREENGKMVNEKTGKPVQLYVNTRNHDTILAEKDKVVNNHIDRKGDTYYVMAGTDEEYKIKIEGDEYKLKSDDGDYKYKREGNGYKVKHGDYKKKVEKDGDVKIKNGNVKIKIDGKTGERKVKVDD